jgi:hypothetical protein
VHAQTPLTVPDVTFDTAGNVLAVARDSSGRILVGGAFNQVGGLPRSNLARLLPDGSVDPDFVCNASSVVRAIAVSASGQIYLGGSFSSINGVTKARLARVDASCVIDAAFPAQAPGNGTVNALALDSGDAKLFVGGSFSSPRTRIARVDTDVGAFDPEVAFTVTGTVYAVLPDGQGGVFVGGQFGAVGGVVDTANLAHLVRDAVSGTFSVRSNFPAVNGQATNPNSRVNALALGGGHLYFGGIFTQTGASNVPRLAKVSAATGEVDLTFLPEPNGSVLALLLQGDALYAGGGFEQIAGSGTGAHLARIRASDGTVQWTQTMDRTVTSLAVGANGILAGGNFVLAQNQVRPALAEANADTGATTALQSDILSPGGAFTHLRMPDGRLWVGGNFLRVNGLSRAGLARINVDGSLDENIDIGVYGELGVLTLVPDTSGRLFVGGNFSRVDGAVRHALFRLTTSGGVDAAFPLEAQLGRGGVFKILLDGNAMFVMGGFQSIGSVGQAPLVQAKAAKVSLLTNSVDASWNPLITAPSGLFAIQGAALDAANDRLYVGGAINSVDAAPVNLVAALHTETGGLVPEFAPALVGAGGFGEVWALALDPDGTGLYVGGLGLETVNGQTGFGQLFRLSRNDGALDAAWSSGSGTDDFVESIQVDRGFVYACGFLTTSSFPLGDGLLRFDRVGGLADTSYVPMMSSCYHVSLDPARLRITASGGDVFQVGNERQGVATFSTVLFSDGFED